MFCLYIFPPTVYYSTGSTCFNLQIATSWPDQTSILMLDVCSKQATFRSDPDKMIGSYERYTEHRLGLCSVADLN